MNPYEERTERQWFVKGRARGEIRQVADEEMAFQAVAEWNPAADNVAVYRDVHYGPMIEAER